MSTTEEGTFGMDPEEWIAFQTNSKMTKKKKKNSKAEKFPKWSGECSFRLDNDEHSSLMDERSMQEQ